MYAKLVSAVRQLFGFVFRERHIYHWRSARSLAVERYLLGEMNPEQKEQFEAHLHRCPQCLKQVHVTLEFMRHARAAFAEEVTETAGSGDKG